MNSKRQPGRDPSALQKRRREKWESKWASDNYNPNWAGRGVAAEIIEIKQSGELPVNGRVLDIGCGLGEIAAFFAEHGYQALGIDLAESAVERARARYSQYDNLAFKAVDITDVDELGDDKFDIMVDRGCLHTIPNTLIPAYVSNVSKLAADNARLIIFTRAFRKQNRLSRLLLGEWIEEKYLIRRISRIFADRFQLVSYARTHIGRPGDPASVARMPGMMYQLVRI